MTKTAIITGANKGIGLAVAERLIQHDYRVLLACRNAEKGLMAEKYLGSSSKFLELDLSNPESIQLFVQKIKSDYPNLDILYNNAGLIYRDFELTTEGYESMMSVNYFGSYRLSLMLLDNLINTSGKIVQVSSLSMYLARKLVLDDLHIQNSFSPSSRYNLTNLYRSMFAVELENRLLDVPVSISVAHPGVTKSRQSRPHQVKRIKKSFYTYFSTNIETGIAPIFKAIEEMDVSAHRVYAPRIFGFYGKPSTMKHNKIVYNKEFRNSLWSYTAKELNLDL